MRKSLVGFAFAVALAVGWGVPTTAGATSTATSISALPPAALATITAAFQADAQAQTITTGSGLAPAANMDTATAKSFAAMTTNDASVAAYTRTFGFAWDAASSSVVSATVLSQSSTAISLDVDVKDVFHIAGTPNDGAMAHESIAVNDYDLTLSSQPGGLWQVTSLSTAPAPTSTSVEAPGTTGAPAPLPTPQGDPFGSGAATPSVTPAAAPSYNEPAAWNYAEKWNGGCNPYYTCYGNDCQNYVSAILHAGGMPYFNNGFFSWDAQTPDFYNVVDFQDFAIYVGYYQFLSSWAALRTGDFLQVNWSGGSSPDHAAWIDDIEGNIPMIASHTTQHWNYPITNWYSQYPNATYWLIHPE